MEWLLANHDNGRGPIDWADEKDRKRQELDVRGADLAEADLQNLPLARMKGGLTREEILSQAQFDKATRRYLLNESQKHSSLLKNSIAELYEDVKHRKSSL